MRIHRNLFTLCSSILLVLAGTTAEATGQTVLDVVDIRPLIARHDIGNALGLAYNQQLDVLYLAHGSDSRGCFIYTLDPHGNLLNELDFQQAYREEAFIESLAYDDLTGHFVLLAAVPDGAGFDSHVVEMSVDGTAIFDDIGLDADGGIAVRQDGIWQARFSEDLIRHYERDGTFIDNVSVAESFPGFTGPLALAPSFTGGFLIVDHFGRRLIEITSNGDRIAEASTSTLGDGRGLAIATDIASERVFLQIDNEDIFVLARAFVRPIVNDLVVLTAFSRTCDRVPVPGGPAGTCRFRVSFTNSSDTPIGTPAFFVTALEGVREFVNPILLNADGGPGGLYSSLTPDVGADHVLSPGELFTTDLLIGKQDQNHFAFFVDVVGDVDR
jgi:hypothetical protein